MMRRPLYGKYRSVPQERLAQVRSSLSSMLSEDEPEGPPEQALPVRREMFRGADVPARGLFVQVRNAEQLAKSRGGVATLAHTIAPQMVEGEIYKQMSQKLLEGFRAQGVDAEVTQVELGPQGLRAASTPSWMFAAAGVGGLLLGGVFGFLLWKR